MAMIETKIAGTRIYLCVWRTRGVGRGSCPLIRDDIHQTSDVRRQFLEMYDKKEVVPSYKAHFLSIIENSTSIYAN